jgi:hypothetical protein
VDFEVALPPGRRELVGYDTVGLDATAFRFKSATAKSWISRMTQSSYRRVHLFDPVRPVVGS